MTRQGFDVCLLPASVRKFSVEGVARQLGARWSDYEVSWSLAPVQIPLGGQLKLSCSTGA